MSEEAYMVKEEAKMALSSAIDEYLQAARFYGMDESDIASEILNELANNSFDRLDLSDSHESGDSD